MSSSDPVAGKLLSRVKPLWAWGLSALLHVALLLLLTAFVFIHFNSGQSNRHIVPEARLAKAQARLPLYMPRPALEEYLARTSKSVERLDLELSETERWQLSERTMLDAIPLNTVAGQYELNLPSADFSVGRAARPSVTFFASGGNAYSIVYVVDRSGSMIVTLEALKSELIRSIAELQPTQKFHVIFFNEGAPLEKPPSKLVWATQANRRQCYRFMDGVVATGKTKPGPAIRRALSLQPELIYFLTDGDFDPALVRQIREWNTSNVKINTIAYTSQRGGSLLRRIAADSGGVYRFVSEGQLKS